MDIEPIYLSASSLDRWLDGGCPARWHYEQDWEAKSQQELFRRGKIVHRLMEGKYSLKQAEKEDSYAVSMYYKIDSQVKTLGLTFLEPPELYQQFEIMPGVIWTRVIDRMAKTESGRLVALDWKTGGSWKNVEGTAIVPATLGPQSVGYLYPPPPELAIDIGNPWPKSMYYIVAGYRGPAEFLPYEYNEKDADNFMLLVRWAADSIQNARDRGWPKAYGKRCLSCPFAAMCYNVKGHKKLYVKKTHGTKNRKAVRLPTD